MQESLGRRLRLMRAERGLSLREAARRAGVVKETISDIERGKTHPYDVTLAKLAEAYEVPIEELLEDPVPLVEAPQESGQPRITDLVMDAVRNTDEKDWQAIHRAQESEKLQISIPSVENAAIEHLAERDKGELIDGLFELAKSKLKEEQENARLREALEGVTQLREADR
jgi:transcriptional regulator with XRE-family HTH domain